MELSAEFFKACSLSWLCFAVGMGIFHGYRTCPHGQVLSRLLLALSPGILSAYGVHSVQVCNQILAAKQPQGASVSERIYLTSISYTDLGDGVCCRTERYSDGSERVTGEMQSTIGCMEGGIGGFQAGGIAGGRATSGLRAMHGIDSDTDSIF